MRAEDPAAASDAAGALFAGWGTWPWIDHGERPDELIRALRRAVDLTAKAGSRHHARTLNALAIATYYDDRQQPGPGALADVAVEQLDDSVPIDLQIEVLAGACFSGLAPHRARVQLSYAQRLVALCDGGDDLLLELVARHELLASQLVAGDAVGTETSYREALDVMGRHRVPAFATMGFGWLTVAALALAGEVDAALEHLDEVAARHQTSGLFGADLARTVALEHVALLSGRLELLESELPGPIAGSPLGAEHHALAAIVHGDHASATAILRAHPPHSYRRDWSWLGLLSLRAELVERLGDTSQAAPLIQLLQPHQDLLPLHSHQCIQPVSLAVGRLLLLIGDVDRASQSFAAALEMAARFRSPLWQAKAQYYLARAIRRGASANNADPDELERNAAATAERLGCYLAPVFSQR